jgi:hypothetical protein
MRDCHRRPGRDARGGRGVPAQGLKDETDEDYGARLKRSDFFNGTWRTIDALGGMAFRKPPTVDVPAGSSLPRRRDLSGVSMEAFAKEALEEVLSPGRSASSSIIRRSRTPRANVTRSPSRRLSSRGCGRRCSSTPPRASQLEVRRVNNAWVLSDGRARRRASGCQGRVHRQGEDRYRVLDLDESGLYRQRCSRSRRTRTS